MYPKRMKNSLHGFTHVYDTGEEANIRVHGWIEESEDFPGEPNKPVSAVATESAEEATAADLPPAQEVAVTTKKRPGRKPKA